MDSCDEDKDNGSGKCKQKYDKNANIYVKQVKGFKYLGTRDLRIINLVTKNERIVF